MTLRERRAAELLIWAAKIDVAMAQRKITQAKLARLMQTDRATVCRLLKGHDSKASTYLAAFQALDIKVDTLPQQNSSSQ